MRTEHFHALRLVSFRHNNIDSTRFEFSMPYSLANESSIDFTEKQAATVLEMFQYNQNITHLMLRDLNLSRWTPDAIEVFFAGISKMQNLQRIMFIGESLTNLSNEQVQALAKGLNLQNSLIGLDFHSSKFGRWNKNQFELFKEHFPNLSKIKYLDVSGNDLKNLSGEDFQSFVETFLTSTLESLDIQYNGFNQVKSEDLSFYFEALSRMQNLNHLNCGSFLLNEIDSASHRQFCQALSRLKNLKALYLSNCGIGHLNAHDSQCFIDALAKLTQLETLSFLLGELGQLEDEQFENLLHVIGTLKELLMLDLTGNKLGEYKQKFQLLTQYIGQCKQLERLILHCNITNEDQMQATDALIQTLLFMPMLREVSMMGNFMTDEQHHQLQEPLAEKNKILTKIECGLKKGEPALAETRMFDLIAANPAIKNRMLDHPKSKTRLQEIIVEFLKSQGHAYEIIKHLFSYKHFNESKQTPALNTDILFQVIRYYFGQVIQTDEGVELAVSLFMDYYNHGLTNSAIFMRGQQPLASARICINPDDLSRPLTFSNSAAACLLHNATHTPENETAVLAASVDMPVDTEASSATNIARQAATHILETAFNRFLADT